MTADKPNRLLDAFKALRDGRQYVARVEDERGAHPTIREVDWRRKTCQECEHSKPTAGGMICRRCATCPSGHQKRILFTLPKNKAGRALFDCPLGTWDTYPAPTTIRNAQVVAIISSFNEGHRIAATVDSFLTAGGDNMTTVVVDDASTDGSCDNLPPHVLKRTAAEGVGTNCNEGHRLARALGADVLIFSDAHVRVTPDHIAAVTRKCLAEPCIVTPACRAYSGIPIPFFGGRLARRDIISIQCNQIQPVSEFERVGAPLGGVYAMSVETAEILARPTGLLFDTVADVYGYVEEMFGIKAALMGIPCYVYSADPHQHLFKLVSERPGTGIARNRNLVYCLALYFTESQFDARFRAVAETLLSPSEVARLRGQARGKCSGPWTEEEAAAFYDSLPEA